ncbi:MAG: alpha/beta fold hydrolase [Pseudomonadota bacterium]|nr:alpha/beta fold hydrolase [Pseudomonadota bacterium]
MERLPILLIPGLACSARLFASQVAALWPSGPVTVANHCRSGTIAEIARAILDEAPPRFAVAGLSLGGYLTMEIWRQAPDRVTRLALIDTSARPETPEATKVREARIALAQGGQFRKAMDEQFAVAVHEDNKKAIEAVFFAMADESGVDAYVAHQRAIMTRPDSRPTLKTITCPALVIVGADDKLTPPDHAKEMSDGIKGARLVTIPACGHMSTMERPAAVNEALLAWLKA